jgi:hypothetical protein
VSAQSSWPLRLRFFLSPSALGHSPSSSLRNCTCLLAVQFLASIFWIGIPAFWQNPFGRRKGELCYPLVVKRCRVSFTDSDGVEHTVEVEAGSLYEAVGLAIDRFRRCEHVKYEPAASHAFTVEPREPGTEHRLTRKVFDEWLRRPPRSPADVALKQRMRELLDE